jgi:hypothetical protein
VKHCCINLACGSVFFDNSNGINFDYASSSKAVNLAGISERHHWVWDFYSLKKALEAASFVEIKRVSANTSIIKDSPFYPLDVDDKGKARKGAELIHIEATKLKHEIN